jgi:hypothetical protein
MQTARADRRTRRSEQAQEALVFQLERVRAKAALDALVLATQDGLPVAHSGEAELCAELAALAPFIARDDSGCEPPVRCLRAVRIVASQPLLLVFYSREAPPELEPWAEHTQRGIKRILRLQSA